MNISVIIPVFNVERFIERCLVSVMNQTYTEGVECIIVDDKTPDGSMSIVEKLVDNYQGNICFKLLYHQYNKGIAAVRNTGLFAAKGRYIIYLDSDDYCEPDMLEKMYAKALTEKADIVVADFWKTYEIQEIYCSQFLPETKIEIMKGLFNGYQHASCWNKLVERSLYVKNEIEYTDGIDYGEDTLISLRLFYYAKNIVHIHKAFVHYVQYNPNSYLTLRSRKALDNILMREKVIIEFLSKVNLLTEFQSEIFKSRLLGWQTLLFQSKGSLQKEWNANYKDVTPRKVIKYRRFFSIYWRVALFFAACGGLSVYNFMRYCWRIIRRKYCKKLVLYRH